MSHPRGSIDDITDVFGTTVSVGVDCDAVTITVRPGSKTAHLEAGQREQFSRAYQAAEFQAEAWARQHTAVNHA